MSPVLIFRLSPIVMFMLPLRVAHFAKMDTFSETMPLASLSPRSRTVYRRVTTFAQSALTARSFIMAAATTPQPLLLKTASLTMFLPPLNTQTLTARIARTTQFLLTILILIGA